MNSRCEDLFLPHRRAGPGLRHLFLFCAALFARDLRADGGVVRLKQSQGAVTMTVFTPPAIYANAPTDVSILLQRSDSGELLLDAAVTLRFIPARGGFISSAKEFCEIGGNNGTIVATHGQAASKFMYAAPVLFPAEGDWMLEAIARWHEQVISIELPLSALSPEGRLTGLVPYLALPMIAIVLFLGNQWLHRPDRPVPRMPKPSGVSIPPTRSQYRRTLPNMFDGSDTPLSNATDFSTHFPFRI